MSNQYSNVCFWCHIDTTTNPDGCWEWKLARSKDGYGTWGRKGKVHRIAYSKAYGVDVKGYCVLHKCDNRSCCRPAHLFLGDQNDNMKDMVSKGRQAYHRGEENGRAKLTEELVIQIRNEFPQLSVWELSRKYKTPRSTIYKVLSKITWKYI